MKKIFLSLAVTLGFTAYAVFENSQNSRHPLTPPVSLNIQAENSTTAKNANPAPAPTPKPASAPAHTFKDGTFVGSVADAYYGNIQVQAVIQNGQITDVQFLQHPNDRSTSIHINNQAMPYLRYEALQAQSANVDIISGATDSSFAFRQSLAYALNKARN